MKNIFNKKQRILKILPIESYADLYKRCDDLLKSIIDEITEDNFIKYNAFSKNRREKLRLDIESLIYAHSEALIAYKEWQNLSDEEKLRRHRESEGAIQKLTELTKDITLIDFPE